MAALAKHQDARAIGGHQPLRNKKQNPHRKLRTVRKNLTEHIYETQFDWTADQRSLIGSVLTDMAKGPSTFTGLQPVKKAVAKPTQPSKQPAKHKPRAEKKKVVASKPTAKVVESPVVTPQQSSSASSYCSAEGFMGLIQSGNVKQAKSYIRYSAGPMDVKADTRSCIRSVEQDWIRPHLNTLKALCNKIEPPSFELEPVPVSAEEHDGPPVFVHLSRTITSVVVRGKERVTKQQKIRVEVQRTKSYDAWLERNTPITNSNGNTLCCNLINFDTPTVMMTVKTPIPVMIGDIQVGVSYRSEVLEVPCKVSDSVATAYKWHTIDSQISKWGTQYVAESDKLYDQVVQNLVHKWDTVPTQPALRNGSSDTSDSVNAELSRTETVSTETTFFHEVARQRAERFQDYQKFKERYAIAAARKELQSLRSSMIRNVFARSMELANSTHEPAEDNLQDVETYDSVDVTGVPWNTEDVDTVEVINHDTGAAVETNSNDGYVIAGLAEYLNNLPLWERAEAKLKIKDRQESLCKLHIAEDMESVRENADEIARLDAWLHSRESENAVKSDYIRYDEWCEKHLLADQAGALQVHLMYMELNRPSFTLDSGENCYTCKRSHFQHFLKGLKATSDAAFIGPRMSGEAVVTPPVVPGKARGSSPLTSLTNPIPGCKTRLNLPEKQSEESLIRSIILDKDEIPEKFLRLANELKKDVVNFGLVREMTKLYVKSEAGILVPG